MVSAAILERVEEHHAQKPPNPKGLLAQLALLFKMINSFGIEVPQESASGEPASSSVLTV